MCVESHQKREFSDTVKKGVADAEHRLLAIINNAAMTFWYSSWSDPRPAILLGDFHAESAELS